MKIEVGTRVKIVNCPYGEFNGREGIVTRLGPISGAMVSSCEGLHEHFYQGGEDFHLMFGRDEIKPISTLTIEPGKYYLTRDGRKVGPMVYYGGEYPWWGGAVRWDGDGKCDDGSDLDLIAEWTEDDDLNAICDERQDGPFVRDLELTSPYGDGNHPLPPMAGTLKELNVKPGDVVEWIGYEDVGHHTLDFMDNAISYVFDTPKGKMTHFHDDPSFRIISRASDTPKTWGEMTDAEKGAIALAFVEKRPIEVYTCGMWVDVNGAFPGNRAYRIKPEPNRETVTLCGSDIRLKPFIAGHRITFDTIDGKPATGVFRNDNGDVIKMEEV